MKLRLLACALPFALFACGGDDDGSVPIDAANLDGEVDSPSADAPIDSPPVIDAPSTVQVIPLCTGIANPAVTVSAATGAYVPANPTLSAGQVLRFEPGSTVHDMTADSGEFTTDLGDIACLRFTAAGSFAVHCGIHGFTTTITVN